MPYFFVMVSTLGGLECLATSMKSAFVSCSFTAHYVHLHLLYILINTFNYIYSFLFDFLVYSFIIVHSYLTPLLIILLGIYLPTLPLNPPRRAVRDACFFSPGTPQRHRDIKTGIPSSQVIMIFMDLSPCKSLLPDGWWSSAERYRLFMPSIFYILCFKKRKGPSLLDPRERSDADRAAVGPAKFVY